MTKKEVEVKVLASEGMDPGAFCEHLQQFQPDILHVHHAYKAGALLGDSRLTQRQTELTIVTSPGGTDINEDLANPEKRNTVLHVFRAARTIIVQSPEIMQSFGQQLPDLVSRLFYVPKAVFWFGDEPYDLRAAAECNREDMLFLLPSGIRPVKGNLECLELMKRVHDVRPGIRFVAAGPAVDTAYAGRFARKVTEHSSFARWIQAIPLAAMRSAYRASDVVLNTSFSEGLSNSLIEANAAGRPVLASDIRGNHWPVLGDSGDAPAGLLYDLNDPEDFTRKALRLIDDEALRESLGKAGVARQSRRPDVDDEAAGLIAAYQAALGIA